MTASRVVPIDDEADERVAVYADLRHRIAKGDGGYFVAEGRLVVDRLIQSDYEIVSLLVEQGVEAQYEHRLPPGVPIYVQTPDAMSRLVGFDFHRGVIACGRRKPLRSLEHWVLDRSPHLTLAPLGVTEAANLGNLLRTAAAFGINQILLCPGTHDPLSRRVIRTSMAAVFKHHFYHLEDPTSQLRWLAEQHGVRTVATTLAPQATPIDQFVLDDRRTILLLGSEAQGLAADTQLAATDRVTIPMQLGTNSLNVAVAAALFMYELTSQSRPTLTPIDATRHTDGKVDPLKDVQR